MLKPARSGCPTHSDSTYTTQHSNCKNDPKINSDMTSTSSIVNVEKVKPINQVLTGDRNKQVISPFLGKGVSDRKQSEASNLDLNGLDDIFNTMKHRIRSDFKNENLVNEKFKISRAINLLFKNNLSEFTLNDFKIVPLKETLNQIKGNNPISSKNVNNINLSQTNNVNKEKMLFSTINETKPDKNIPVFNVDNSHAQKIENTNTLINKKRLPQFTQLTKCSDKVAKLSEKISENKFENIENSKLILEEANIILNKNKLKLETLSTGGINSADASTPKNTFRPNPSNYKSDPITALAYPSSINTEAHKNKANSTSNVHFNINITNIVDSNNKIIQALNPLLSSDQYAKIVSDLKESLKKKEIIFNEQHSSTNYVLYFKVPSNKTYKQYRFVIDSETSKIIRYEKSKEKEKLVEINNSEDCSERLIFHELMTLKKELDLGN